MSEEEDGLYTADFVRLGEHGNVAAEAVVDAMTIIRRFLRLFVSWVGVGVSPKLY